MQAQFFIDLILVLFYAGILFLLMVYVWRFWMLYLNQKFINKLNHDSIMLEIKLPRDIYKSPEAMENVISSMLQNGSIGSHYKKFWLGNMPTYFSLEIASLEGVIHFYIRTEKKFRSLIESNLYAQYPGIEIVLVDDYTKLIHYNHLSKNTSAWGITYGATGGFTPNDPETGKPYKIKKDGKEEDYKINVNILPIKTYVDYGLDKDPKEEYKNDPLVPLLEFMGQAGKGEHVWYQILVQDEAGAFNAKHSGETGKKFPKTFVNEITHEHFTFKDLAEKSKEQIRKVKKIKKGSVVFDQYGNPKFETKKEGDTFIPVPLTYAEDQESKIKENELTIEEKDQIEAINRKLNKPTGRAVVRLLYVTKAEKFRTESIQQILSILRPFNGESNLAIRTISAPYDNPWEDLGGRRTAWRTEELFEAYVEREGFYPHIPPIETRKFLESTEDVFFWKMSMKYRKVWRMIYEVLLYPFAHAYPKEISVFNTEELATLYHFPGQVAAVPTLPRIDSTKSMSPSNLPQ